MNSMKVNRYKGCFICLILLTGFSFIQTLSAQNKLTENKIDISNNQWYILLDKEAEWKNDDLHLPPVDISKLPVNPPTGGWKKLYQEDARQTRLPATVEQYYWGENGNSYGVNGDYLGVSWFFTDVFIPEDFKNKRISLKFESVRMRAEVFLNQKLVGYDLIDGTPFDVDITKYALPGENNKLAVRITDPGGNFVWNDFRTYYWGDYTIPASRGFGGITGRVWLKATDQVFIDDVFVKNTPSIKNIDIEISLKNQTKQIANGIIELKIENSVSTKEPLYHEKFSVSDIEDEESIIKSISCPKALTWSPETPNLYKLIVNFKSDEFTDKYETKFGFKWFGVKDTKDGDRQFILNNKRIVLKGAVSWGLYPETGICPTKELAEKQTKVAKELGLNIINFHRAIGHPMLMDTYDEMGLLCYEEPGGYLSARDEFSKKWMSEKVKRMVKRDRNHPSLIMYNFINELAGNLDPKRTPDKNDIKNLKELHRLDETRYHLFTTTFFPPTLKNGHCPTTPDSIKIHLEPYNHKLLLQGIWAQHYSMGNGVYYDDMYNGKSDFLRYNDHKTEILYYPEEQAVGAMPDVTEIRNSILKSGIKGWEGQDYLDLYEGIRNELDIKGFTKAFPTVKSLTKSLGNVAFYTQGRCLENFRINNNNDGYILNGWEGEKLHHRSGIVDVYRNPKGDPEIFKHYTQPLYIAVMPTEKVVETGETIKVDFYIINEENVKGNHTLNIKVEDEHGIITETSRRVNILGGTNFSQLLAEGFELKINHKGYTKIEASLAKGQKEIANGNDDVFAVNLEAKNILSKGMVLDTTGVIQKFITKHGGSALKEYKFDMFNYNSYRPNKDYNYLIVGESNVPIELGIADGNTLLNWVSEGNNLIIVGNSKNWAQLLSDQKIIDYRGYEDLSQVWFAGNYFVKDHELFNELPVNTAFNWEYQALARYWKGAFDTPSYTGIQNRYALRLNNEENMIVGATSDLRNELFSAVTIISHGRGKIILSSLNIIDALKQGHKANAVAGKILLNYIEYVSTKF